jgi:hypothetical protein
MAKLGTEDIEALIASAALCRLVSRNSRPFGVPCDRMRVVISEAPALGVHPFGAAVSGEGWAASRRPAGRRGG